MKKEKLVCFRCRKEIDPKSNYYSFLEFNDEKFVKADHAHKICWDVFLQSVSDVKEARGMLKGLKKYLNKMGIIEEDPAEVLIR